jgi:hypothetical protein
MHSEWHTTVQPSALEHIPPSHCAIADEAKQNQVPNNDGVDKTYVLMIAIRV